VKKKSRLLLILIGLFILTGGALNLTKISILYLENTDRPKSHPIRVSSSERFAVIYFHSIYKEPVIEQFQVDQGAIILKGVRTRHPGILEYYGFEDMKEFHPMDRRVGAPLFRVAMGEPQSLVIQSRKISFNEVGERGDQIQLRLDSVSLGHDLYLRVFPQTFVRDRKVPSKPRPVGGEVY
jgi:hypothetical protein